MNQLTPVSTYLKTFEQIHGPILLCSGKQRAGKTRRGLQEAQQAPLEEKLYCKKSRLATAAA